VLLLIHQTFILSDATQHAGCQEVGNYMQMSWMNGNAFCNQAAIERNPFGLKEEEVRSNKEFLSPGTRAGANKDLNEIRNELTERLR